MNNFFEHSNSNWVKYSKYELKADEHDVLYITPAKDATPEIYNPLKNIQQIVLDALNIGAMCMRQEAEENIQNSIMNFVSNHGLLGIMTAITTTPNFMDYEAVYLTKNLFIKEESMSTFGYLSYFFPFEKPDVNKTGVESTLNVEGDVAMMALALTMSNRPMAINLEFQRSYAERYDWVKKLFKDWAFIFITSTIYYDNEVSLDKTQRELYKKSMATFDGISPAYHIELLDKPTLVWDFHSLVIAIQMMFCFMLTDEKNPIKLCKHCQTVFVASRPRAAFCSPTCKNRYNVYKSRAKNKDA